MGQAEVMRASFRRRVLAASAATATLWLMFALVRWALWQTQGPAAQLARLVPAVVPTSLMWGDSGPWFALTVAVGAIAVALAHAWFITVTRGRGSVFVAAWFATVAAGALIGLALDIAGAWGSFVDFGPRGLLAGEFGAAVASGALWGLIVGWMPGLLARTPVHAAAGTADVDAKDAVTPAWKPRWLLPVVVIAVIAVATAGVVADNARTAALEAEDAARQEAEAAVTFGALPDPDASGVPVPEKAQGSTDASAGDPQWCTPERAMLLKGEPDAATGHRGLPITLMNFSDVSCVIEGYPDVAFGDQNQHLLAVTVEQGGSFMAQDPGPQRIEVPAGGSAVAVLGWDAASPHGALVTKTVYAAPTAGMLRGSWPIDLDIAEGSTVSITAWAIETVTAPDQ